MFKEIVPRDFLPVVFHLKPLMSPSLRPCHRVVGDQKDLLHLGLLLMSGHVLAVLVEPALGSSNLQEGLPSPVDDFILGCDTFQASSQSVEPLNLVRHTVWEAVPGGDLVEVVLEEQLPYLTQGHLLMEEGGHVVSTCSCFRPIGLGRRISYQHTIYVIVCRRLLQRVVC